MACQETRDHLETSIEEVKPRNNEIFIKCFQPKFMGEVNQLNSSILIAKTKTFKTSRGSISKQRSCSYESQNSFSLVRTREAHSYVDSPRLKKRDKGTQNHSYIIIEGTKVNGVLNGRAVLELRNRNIFTGVVENGEPKQGLLQMQNGTTYEGKFKNQIPHGEGILRFKNGTEYRTTFKNGHMEKRGEIMYDNGDLYRGQIKRYKKHGFGELLMKNGDKYIGDFENGQITGQGVYYKKGKVMAEGLWKSGQFQGKNLYRLSDAVVEHHYRA